MARSTYHDQFNKLIDKGYLILSHGNTYEFYEVPKFDTPPQNLVSPEGLDYANNPASDTPFPPDEQDTPPEGIEINNRSNVPYTNKTNISVDGGGIGQEPLIKEIRIPVPVAEGRKRPICTPKPEKAGFVF